MQQFYSNGKLLLSAEYLILDGAKGLALPTVYGQNLVVKKMNSPEIKWKSLNADNKIWFEHTFQLPDIQIYNIYKKAITLQKILKEAQKLNPDFLNTQNGFLIETKLTFPRNWGLGSSSTLINNIAKWANINAYDLLQNSFGGSGYDIACAESDTPILYRLKNRKPKIEPVNFNPSFKDRLYFIYLNQKQNSALEIKKYRENGKLYSAEVEEISKLSTELLYCSNLTDFEKILGTHERIIASIIKQQPVQEKMFSDYFGQTKSLGAWGGDFILATGNDDTPFYFKNKGFNTVIPYGEMILNK